MCRNAIKNSEHYREKGLQKNGLIDYRVAFYMECKCLRSSAGKHRLRYRHINRHLKRTNLTDT